MTDIHIEQGDITSYKVDAIVNAANNDLILGGGLAGAIARKGGQEIQKECNKIGPIKVGQAAITTAGKLPAKYVIHAASMRLGGVTSAESLESSTRACLEIADRYKLESIAFPAIGTGIARFPLKECAKIMLGIIIEHARKQTTLKDVYIVLYDNNAYEIFLKTYQSLTANK